MQSITLTRPDDWHLHLRDGEALNAVAPFTATQFARAIVMPNLQPPITKVDQALAYRERVLAATSEQPDFNPLMTLYLTNNTTADEIKKAAQSEHVHAVKLYPAGATTNSEHGLTSIDKGYDAIAAMEEHGLPLLVHGEVTRSDVDVFDREARFVDELLSPLMQRFPKLKLVLEHITTGEGIDFVNSHGNHVGGTLTPQHLLLNRNALFQGGIRPHHYCLPVLKRETHRVKLLAAATSGSKKFFLGTDSAPHAQHRKETACGCAGIFSAHAAIELYAEAFEQAGALDKLEAFASFNGPDFYNLPRNTTKVTLVKQEWNVPESYAFGSDKLIPFRAGETVRWKLKAD
ncbi:MAG: dihydroorotase [Gammaproteobacteria bacterium]|nr:dihydroorotase [Gammaproteobacteria bacterium]